MATVWQAGGDASSIATTFLPLLFAFLLFYLLLIRPQQTRQKKWNAMVETLKSGDRVTTSGGLRGIITRVKDDSFVLRVAPDNLQLEVVKTAIVSVTTEEEKK
jgi:preprotein translocase subunit YajC